MNISDFLIVDSSGTIIPADECTIVHKTFFEGEAVLSDSEASNLAQENGLPLKVALKCLPKSLGSFYVPKFPVRFN